MYATPSKAALLELIDHERVAWEQFVAEVGEDRMLQPGAMGDWTFKDVVAHLSGWRTKTLSQLDAAQSGQSPAPPPWPAELDEDTDSGVDQMNDWIY